MRNLILVLVALLGLTVSAQEQAQEKSKMTRYLSVGYSIGNHQDGKNFDETSFPNIELGVTSENLSLGVALGRGQTFGLAKAGDKLTQYYYEFKATQAFPMSKCINGRVVLGLGSYFGTNDKAFIEYGFGLTKKYGKITYGLTYSNFDSENYVTPTLSYSF